MISFILYSQFKDHKGLLRLKFQTGTYHLVLDLWLLVLEIGSGWGPKIQFVSYLRFPSLDSFGYGIQLEANSGYKSAITTFSKKIPVLLKFGVEIMDFWF